jgi:uncharacterized protein (TIRG00374 family)
VEGVTKPSGSRTYIRWALALLLACTAAWLSIRQVRWSAFKSALAHPDWSLLALALGTVLLTTAVKAIRWRLLLGQCSSRASGWRVLRVLFIGQMVNNLFSRLGDLARAVLLGHQATGGIPAVLGTLLVEKALDGVVGLLILVGLALWTPLPSWLRGPLVGLAVLTFGLLLLLILAAVRQGRTGNLARRLVGWLPAAVQDRAERLLAGLALGLGLFRQPARALLALVLSTAVWGLGLLTNLVTLAALGIDAPLWGACLVLVAGYVATFLPTVPAQIGVFEYACVLSLTAAGVDPEPALAFGLVLHLLVYAPPALLGSVSMAVEGLNWAALRAAQREYGEHDYASP